MTFTLNPTLVGCGKKVPLNTIRSISDELKLSFGADAALLHVRGVTLNTSIDRIGRFCSSLDLFASLAVDHFIGDMIASDAEPVQMSLCLECGPELESGSDISGLTSAFVSDLGSRGIEVGNLHSVKSDYTAVTACVIGVSRMRKFVSPSTGKLFLSDRLGAFKALIISELDGESAKSRSHIDARLFLGELPPMITAGSDVTGFGLQGTLQNLAERHRVRMEVIVSESLAFNRDVLEAPIACIDGGRFFTSESERTSTAQKLTNMSEVAGPMVMLCNADQEGNFLSWFSRKTSRMPIQIGLFTKSDSPSVRIAYN